VLSVWILSSLGALGHEHFLLPRSYPGKWHRVGQAACYGFEHPAVGLLEREVVTHGHIAAATNLYEAILPATGETVLDLGKCKAGQDRVIGGSFFDSGNFVAFVPSSVCSEGKVFLINPRHAAFTRIQWIRVRSVHAVQSALLNLENAC